jgi:hypothetical protein
VRLLTTAYVMNASSPVIYAIAPPSALASETPEQVRAAVRAAHRAGLKTTLCPVIDPSWDEAGNARSSASNNFTWRGEIGANFSVADWATFFESFSGWIAPFVALAAEEGVDMFEVSSELDRAFSAPGNDAAWRQVVTDIRRTFKGTLSIAVGAATALVSPWMGTLDSLGVDAYGGLGEPVPLGTAPSVASLVAAWDATQGPQLARLEALYGLPVFLSETGFQSRPNCHVKPWGTPRLDVDDDSAWVVNTDMDCQANAYEALLTIMQRDARGVYLWLWRTDPTQGGSFDSDFTPHGKPAEAVMRHFWGGAAGDGSTAVAAAITAAGASGAAPPAELVAVAEAAALLPFSAQRSSASAALVPHARTRRTWNGFCWGGPDEWSSPLYRLGSAGANSSLDNMLATGADSIEIIVQWYVDGENSTDMYAITDPSSPLATSSDAELAAFARTAKARGLKTVLTPMLDPNWLLPANSACRDSTAPGCWWRGQIGRSFPAGECGVGSLWAQWFTNYETFILRYAVLASLWGTIDAFLISHELTVANGVCPDLWRALLFATRAAFPGGAVSAALMQPSSIAAASPWAADLDFLGVDCYFAPVGLVRPALPWQDSSLADLLAAQSRNMPALAALSASLGNKPIVCTEMGSESRPWGYATWGGTTELTGEDCSVADQCVSTRALTLWYTATLQLYYAQPWFDGVLFWIWAADPTHGGASDSGLTPAGKADVIDVLRAFWGPVNGPGMA